MEVKLFDCMNDSLFNISISARTCFNSRHLDNPSNRIDFVKSRLLANRHETPIEFTHFIWDVKDISRITMTQIVRHRLASYCVESQRYCDMKNRGFVIPNSILKVDDNAQRRMQEMVDYYYQLVCSDVPKEDARYVLPEGMMCNMMIDMNGRELRNFLKLRTDKHAQWEIRSLAIDMYNIMKEIGLSVLVDDIDTYDEDL